MIGTTDAETAPRILLTTGMQIGTQAARRKNAHTETDPLTALSLSLEEGTSLISRNPSNWRRWRRTRIMIAGSIRQAAVQEAQLSLDMPHTRTISEMQLRVVVVTVQDLHMKATLKNQCIREVGSQGNLRTEFLTTAEKCRIDAEQLLLALGHTLLILAQASTTHTDTRHPTLTCHQDILLVV